MDLYVGHYNAANKLYRNEGDGTFSDVSSIAGVADSGQGFGAAWADYDGTVSGAGNQCSSGYHVWCIPRRRDVPATCQ